MFPPDLVDALIASSVVADSLIGLNISKFAFFLGHFNLNNIYFLLSGAFS